MEGNTFTLYANNSPSPITTLTDSAKTYASGDVGFFASAANVNTEVVFSNLKVYQSS